MRSSVLAFALLMPVALPSQADVLEMPEATQSALVDKPAKGVTMKTVLASYGTPSKKYPPVGGGSKQQPPITRWDYPGFSVFFEHDHVVDAVVPGRPPALQRTEELQ
jgi:hypothetical protein